MSSPSERLALSRERLRQAMGGPDRAAKRAASAHAPGPASAWLDELKAHPVGAIAIDALLRWWAQHPLRLASVVAADATAAVVRPIAQRNPLGLVVAALLLGGALAWTRPWRWLLKPVSLAGLAGLAPPLVSRIIAGLPTQSWLALLTLLTQPKPERQDVHAEAPPTASVATGPASGGQAGGAKPAADVGTDFGKNVEQNVEQNPAKSTAQSAAQNAAQSAARGAAPAKPPITASTPTLVQTPP